MNSHNTSVSVSGRRLGLRLVFAVLAAAVLTATWITPVGAAKRARPPVPVGVTAQGGGVGEVLLSWQDPGDGVTAHSYRYKAVKGSEGWVRWSRVPVGVTEVTVRGLDSGVKYRFQVRALKDSRRSHSVSVKAKPTAPPVTVSLDQPPDPLLQREDPEPQPDPPPQPDPEPLPEPEPEPPEEKPDIPDQQQTRPGIDTALRFRITERGPEYDLNRTREKLERCVAYWAGVTSIDDAERVEDVNVGEACEHFRPLDRELANICIENRGRIYSHFEDLLYYGPPGSGAEIKGDCSNLAPVKPPMCPGDNSSSWNGAGLSKDNCGSRGLAQARSKATTRVRCLMEWNSRWCVVNEDTGAGYCARARNGPGWL